MRPMTWHEKTLSLLKATPIPLRTIARDNDLSVDWISRFKRGVIPEPGIGKVQKLHDYLAGRQKRRP